MPLKRELMQCADLVPITTFCLFWWNFSRNGSYHICLHMATHGQLVTSCTSPSLGCRTVVSATPPKPKMPPSWSNRVWSRWCLSVAPCHGIMVPDAWRKTIPDLRKSSAASRRNGKPTSHVKSCPLRLVQHRKTHCLQPMRNIHEVAFKTEFAHTNYTQRIPSNVVLNPSNKPSQ